LIPNYLLVLVVVVVVEFDLVVLPFVFVVEVVLVVDVVEPLVLLVLVAAGVEAGVEAGVAVAAFAGLLVLPLPALFVPVLSGQAAPNKPNVKTAERAITFFISIKFSCLLQRMYIYLLFNDLPKKVVSLKLILEQWTI
jgi:hypothetical protein